MIHKKLTDEQVNQEIAETDLYKIADLFDSIGELCEQFGLSRAEKTDVRRLRNVEGTKESVTKALKSWRNRYPSEATFKNLLIILLDSEKGVVAEDVADYISNRPQQEPTINQPRPDDERQCYYQYFISAVVVVLAIGMGLLVMVPCNEYSITYKIPTPNLTMTDYEQYKANKTKWYSPPVYTHHQGYKICLSVYANGWNSGEVTVVAVGVHFMRGEFDDSLKWPFRGTISWKLLNQVNGKDHKTHTLAYDVTVPDVYCTRVTEGERSWGRGIYEFIAHTELELKYLRNDTLLLQIHKVKLKYM